MSMMQEFKEFAMRGSVVDMAVGIVIGAAFGRIVSSFVDDILMPPISLLTGGVDFTERGIVLRAATEEAEAVVFAWGAFLQNVIDFAIIAFAIFMVIRAMNRMQRKEEEPEKETPPEPSKEEKLLMEIRDAIRNQGTP